MTILFVTLMTNSVELVRPNLLIVSIIAVYEQLGGSSVFSAVKLKTEFSFLSLSVL